MAWTNFLQYPPDFDGYQATVQPLPNGTEAPVALDANTFDTYSGHSNVTNNTRYTFPFGGIWTVSGSVAFAPNATGVRGASLRLNGTTDVIGSQIILPTITASGVNTNVPCRTKDIQVNSGDYVELMATQTSGAALNTQTTGQNTSGLTCRLVHR